MAQKPLFADLIAAHPGLAEELKTLDVAADLATSDELRAKLAERQTTQADVAAAVDWARAKTPTN
jgi:glutamine synthetase adenylyltransferase